MSSSGSDHEEDSILNNLNKTRQLWSSKADLGTADYLVPKSPIPVVKPTPRRSTSSSSNQHDVEPKTPVDVVRADEQVVEDYELPDIKSMRSQWEVQNQQSYPVPSPSQKAPAVLAREKSVKRQLLQENIVPVNREETEEDENYAVELGKLKAQFENANKKSSNANTQPVAKSAVSKSAIKESVSKRKTSLKTKPTHPELRKIRFQDELFVATPKTSEVHNAELNVDLNSIKSQFENRKDEQVVALQSTPHRPKTTSNMRSPEAVNHVATDVVRPDDEPTEEKYEVELGALKKKFENRSQPKSEPVHVIKSKDNEAKVHHEVKSIETTQLETVKSSEPVYDEMIGEESVKDRLKRYKSLTEADVTKKPTVERRISQKKSVKSVEKAPVAAALSNESVSSEDYPAEVVRSPPAGTKITPDYTPSVDLLQTKALFEVADAKPKRSRPASASDSSVQSPPRSSRSPVPQTTKLSRSSSRQSTSSTSSFGQRSRSRSPGQARTERASVTSENEEMADVVRPPPAGTKEAPDYVPAVKVSSMKNMFEKPSSTASSPTSGAPPPRKLRSKDWVNGNEQAVSSASSDESFPPQRKVVPEGSYEEKEGGVVRPPTAGTKEQPAYSLDQNFLKSRTAMFDSPTKDEYTPKNKIKPENKRTSADVVNTAGKTEIDEYQLSNSLTDTKKMFEGGAAPSTDRPVPAKRTEIVATPDGEIVRPPPAGTRDDSDIVPAQNLNSVKQLFDHPQEVVQEPERKQPVDIQKEAKEAIAREKELAKKAEKAEQEHEQQPEAEQPHYEQPEVQEEPEPVETEPEPVETEPEPVETEPEPVKTEPELAQTYQEPVEDEQEPVETGQEPVETGQEPVETEQAPATQEATPRHETDSEEEGEYVLEAQQTNNEQVDQSVEDGHVSDDEEAAAVTPVRVAVPSPTPEQDDSTQQNEEGAQNNDETTTALADDLDEKLNVTDDVNGLDDVNETDGVRAEHHTDSHGTETVLKSDESYHEDNLITENDVMQVEDPLEQEILAATDEVSVKAAKPEPIISNGVEADGDQYTQ